MLKAKYVVYLWIY